MEVALPCLDGPPQYELPLRPCRWVSSLAIGDATACPAPVKQIRAHSAQTSEQRLLSDLQAQKEVPGHGQGSVDGQVGDFLFGPPDAIIKEESIPQRQ